MAFETFASEIVHHPAGPADSESYLANHPSAIVAATQTEVLHYGHADANRALFFMHGNGFDPHKYERTFQALVARAADIHIIAPVAPGVGKSSPAVRGETIGRRALQVVRQQIPETAERNGMVLVGNSLGGYSALQVVGALAIGHEAQSFEQTNPAKAQTLRAPQEKDTPRTYAADSPTPRAFLMATPLRQRELTDSFGLALGLSVEDIGRDMDALTHGNLAAPFIGMFNRWSVGLRAIASPQTSILEAQLAEQSEADRKALLKAGLAVSVHGRSDHVAPIPSSAEWPDGIIPIDGKHMSAVDDPELTAELIYAYDKACRVAAENSEEIAA